MEIDGEWLDDVDDRMKSAEDLSTQHPFIGIMSYLVF